MNSMHCKYSCELKHYQIVQSLHELSNSIYEKIKNKYFFFTFLPLIHKIEMARCHCNIIAYF